MRLTPLEDVRPEDVAVLALFEILKIDPSIREIADLPPGWHAWRPTVGAPWRREPITDDDDDEQA